MHQVHRLHAPQHSCMDDLQGTQQLVCRFAAHTSGTVTAADLSALRLSTMATRTKNFIRRTASKLAAMHSSCHVLVIGVHQQPQHKGHCDTL